MTAPAWYTDRAVRLAGLGPAALERHRAALAALPGVAVRPGLDSLVVESPTPDPGLLATVTTALAATATTSAATPVPPREHVIVVHYTGEDLDQVAALLDLSVPALIAAHTATTWQVAMLGFAPGFGYLRPRTADHLWSRVPRRTSPRPRVPAGALGVADAMTAVYPAAMPGGWQILGHTDTTWFDPAADPPARLAAGDLVRFTPGTP